MATSYATVADYRLDADDEATAAERIEAVLAQQSAKLRAECRISEDRFLTDDQATMARMLVTDAARKRLVPPTVGSMDVSGVTQGSFTANGFQESYTLSNPSATAYFDTKTLNALKKSLGTAQAAGFWHPSYGGAPC